MPGIPRLLARESYCWRWSKSGAAEYCACQRAMLLSERLDPTGFEALRPLLADPDPLLRSAAARALAALPPELKVQHLAPLLDDPCDWCGSTRRRV